MNHNTVFPQNQLSFAAFRKGVVCAINGMTILDEIRLPAQYGGGVVCRDDQYRMSYRTDGAGYYVFTGKPDVMRAALIEHLWLSYNHQPSKAKHKRGRYCAKCAKEFYPVGAGKYCSESCYIATWQASKRSKKAVSNV